MKSEQVAAGSATDPASRAAARGIRIRTPATQAIHRTLWNPPQIGRSISQVLMVVILLAVMQTTDAQDTHDFPTTDESGCSDQNWPDSSLHRFGEYTVESYQWLGSTNTLTLVGARLWSPGGRDWCWWWDGQKYITLQSPGGPPVVTDLNGNGIPDLLVTRNPQQICCEHDIYLIELGDMPRLLSSVESWARAESAEAGFEWCYMRVESLDGSDTYSLITGYRLMDSRPESIRANAANQ